MSSWKQCAVVACLGMGVLGGCKKPAPKTALPPVAALAAIVATCASASGEVTARPKDATYWEPVSVGSVFRLADWVRTGALSSARVEFLSGGRLELDPKTIVIIDRAPAQKPGEAAGERVALQQGSVHGYFPKRESSTSTPLRLRTADGTELSLSPLPGQTAEFRLEQRNGKTEVAVLSGAARIATQAGVRSLKAGQFAKLGPGGLPGEAEELIAYPASVSPGVDARFHGGKELSVELGWKEVPGASGYQVQIARDLSFQQLVTSEGLATTKHAFRPGEMGMFAWRVASRDRDGRLGEYGFVRRLFVEIEAPVDRLEAPASGAVLKLRPEDRITFLWESTGDSHYRFVLSRTQDLLSAPLTVRSLQTPRFELSGIEPGEYQWGVYLEQEGGALEPIFLSPRKLVVKRAAAMNVRTEPIRKWGE